MHLVVFQIVLDFNVSKNKGQFSSVDKRVTLNLLYSYSVPCCDSSSKSGVANVPKLIMIIRIHDSHIFEQRNCLTAFTIVCLALVLDCL